MHSFVHQDTVLLEVGLKRSPTSQEIGDLAYRVFDTSRGSLVDTLKSVIGDVKWFLLFIFLTMLSFGIAFSILYRDQVIEIDGVEDKVTTIRSDSD